jgi:gluconate 2-dehydrogenase gamma chain
MFCGLAGENALQEIEYPRRQFIKNATIAAGGAILFSSCGKPPGRWRFFTEAEAETVSAVSEQIIPADEDPGAIAAGVPNFIDKQLMGPYQRFQEVYRAGLVGVDETSQLMFGKRLAYLGWTDQTAVLKALESGKAKGEIWQAKSPSAFFEMIRDHSLQGYYGNPRHGGNRNYVSYRMMKIDYPQIIGQNRYRKT